MERQIWIDTLRGISLFAILLFHTEYWYTGGDVINITYYLENAYVAFAFLCGYLFMKPQMSFSFKGKLMSMVGGMVLPYVVFTLFFALCRYFFVSDGVSFVSLLTDILTGHVSWLVAALIVAELIFAFIVWISRGKMLLSYLLVSCLLLFLSLLSGGYLGNINIETIDIWSWQEAFILLFFMFLGFFYRHNEQRFKLFNSTLSLFFLIILIIVLKYYEQSSGLLMSVNPVAISSYFVFVADGVISVLMLINVCKRLPSMSVLTFIGRNSLIAYLLCGAITFLISFVFKRIGLPYNGSYFSILLVYIFVIDFTTISTYILIRFVFPFFQKFLKSK